MEMNEQETSVLLKENDPPLYSRKRRIDPRLFYFLLAILALFVVATIVLVVVLGLQVSDEEGECLTPNTCTTDTCIQATSFLSQGLDTTANPCEDFYKYSCGNWEDTNVIPGGFGRYSTFGELGTSNSIALKKSLEQSVPEGDDGAVSKARYMYSRCMDVDRLSSFGPLPLQELITLTGGWELVMINEPDPNWDLAEFLSNEHYHGSDAFFRFSIQADDYDSNVVIIKLTQSGITLPSSTYYADNEHKNITTAYMKSVLLLLGAVDGAELDQAIDEIYTVEANLAEIFYSPTELRNLTLTYNLLTIGNFTDSYTSLVVLSDYLNEYFVLAGSETTFTDEDTIVVGPLGYFVSLDEYLSSVSNIEILKNYAKWSLVRAYIALMGQDFLDAYYAFNSAVTGNGERERYLTCIELAESSLPMAVARPFADKFFTDSSRQEIADIITAVRNTFKQRLEGKDWLDGETKQRCREKVDKISEAIAYPEYIKDDEQLNEFYGNVSIDESSELFDAYLKVLSFTRADEVSQYGKPTDKTRWYLPPTVVNAYYDPSYNRFVFLAGILRHPFFEAGWPSYLSYGALGVVIGHELTHGFDDQGQQYDADGNRRQWWTERSQKAFQERTKCFEDQYSGYELDGYQVNGSLTLGENIADNGGVHMAFEAYKNHNGNLLKLPGTNLTNDQLFFVAFGQVWCTLYTEEYLRLQVTTDPHSPGPIRVLGALSNSKEFADAFKCPVGSRMNPPEDEKCLLW